MPLPDFLCVGAAKAGTTTLHDILVQHPDIYLPSSKESLFFASQEYFDKGLSWYEREIFGEYNNEQVIGEISPSYFYFDHAPERIYRTLGGRTKLIFMFRNPVNRAFSHYLMAVRRTHETESFEQAISIEEDRVRKGFFNAMRFSYIGSSLYAMHLKKYLRYFPKESMFFILFEEDFLRRREETIKKLQVFLGIKCIDLKIDIRSNIASYPKIKLINTILFSPNLLKQFTKILMPSLHLRQNIKYYIEKLNARQYSSTKLSDNTRKFLLEKYFLKEIDELQKLIERDLSIWTKDHGN